MIPDQALVLIHLGRELLALPREEYERALERGRAMSAPPAENTTASASCERWLTAEEMENQTGVPASWWLEQARKGAVPHFEAGKYRRFRVSDVALVLAHRGAPTDERTLGPRLGAKSRKENGK